MIKSKKSTTDVASKFRKAARAHNAFKPKSAGATESPNDQGGSGDGITGVFQAPSLLRSTTQDESRPSTPREAGFTRPTTPETKKEPPSVTITTSPLKPVQVVEPMKPDQIEPPPPKSPERAKKPAVPGRASEERRKHRQSDHAAKYAKLLGIHPSLLEGRTSEIETTLNDFGMAEESNQTTAFEELETGLRKELARIEAGSWLGAVENNDDRAMAVNDMMDRVIAECEELDGLLTLYNVELSVSWKPRMFPPFTDDV